MGNGGTVCGNWPQGSCCSASGYCGNTTDHCANGCQSGPCIVGGETFDGTCGPSHGNTVCGAWAQGSCCSAAGYCGSTTDHCGAGCLSGPCTSATNTTGPSGEVYISPDILSSPDPVVYCVPPCSLILPPLVLPSATTISFPLLTTSLEVAWLTSQVTTLANGDVSTSTGYDRITETTTLTIPPVTTSLINLWNVNITGTQTDTSSVFYITSSVLPPPFTITDDQNPRSQSGVTHPPATRTITPPPYPYSTTFPGSNDHPPLTWKPGPPSPRCLVGCGHKCRIFCHFPCFLSCPDGGNDFLDPNDPNPPDGSQPKPTGPTTGPTTEPTTSCTTSTVTDYFVSCSSINPTSSSCTTTSSAVTSGCDVLATTKTTAGDTCPTVSQDNDQGQDGGLPAPTTSRSKATITAPPSTTYPYTFTDPVNSNVVACATYTVVGVNGGITYCAGSSTVISAAKPSCSMHNEDPGQGIFSAYCVCDGSSAFPLLTSTDSCAYTSLPSSTINPIASRTVVTSDCQVCTQVGPNQDNCFLIDGCTPTGTTTTTAAPSPTKTNDVVIGLRSIGTSGGSGTGATLQWWDVYNAIDNQYDGCAKALHEEGISGSNDNQKYPTKLGPFDLSGPRNCYYGGPDSNTVGTVTCDNGVSIPCFELSAAFSTHRDCNSPDLTQFNSFRFLISCSYNAA